jgi:hypothetical protein
MPTLLIFLIPYSIVATVAVVVLYKRQPDFHPLETLPDPDAPKNGARRIRTDLALPRKLRVALGESLRVGDVQVMPKQVVRLPGDRLALTLTIANLSDDVEFNPVSPTFTRYVRNVPKALKPYTYLEAGEGEERKFVYGGVWRPARAGPLSPGKDMSATLTTDVRDAAAVRELLQFGGPLLWRVQVRRGLVEYKGKEVSATAVVGVEFQAADVRRPTDRARAAPAKTRAQPWRGRAALALLPIRLGFVDF